MGRFECIFTVQPVQRIAFDCTDVHVSVVITQNVTFQRVTKYCAGGVWLSVGVTITILQFHIRNGKVEV